MDHCGRVGVKRMMDSLLEEEGKQKEFTLGDLKSRGWLSFDKLVTKRGQQKYCE